MYFFYMLVSCAYQWLEINKSKMAVKEIVFARECRTVNIELLNSFFTYKCIDFSVFTKNTFFTCFL